MSGHIASRTAGMNGATTSVSRAHYTIHGVGVDVCATDPAVIAAMDLRLRDFCAEGGTDPDVRLEFLSGAGAVNGAPRPDGGAASGDAPPDVDAANGSSASDSVAANGYPPPDVPGRPVYDTPYGSLHYFPESDLLCGELAGVHLRCDAARGEAVFRSAAFTDRQLYLATHPLATISLMELLEHRGLFSLHAACLANGDGRGVLLAGPSGSGKSTLALALAAGGMGLLSDDVVFLAHDEDTNGVVVRGFADAIGLTDRALQTLDGSWVTAERSRAAAKRSRAAAERSRAAAKRSRAAAAEPPIDGFPKPLVRIEELLGTPARSVCTPHALVFPEVEADQPSQIAPLDPGQALLRLVPDVLLTEPVATQAHLAAIGELLEHVSCYTLRSGRDLDRAAALVQEVL